MRAGEVPVRLDRPLERALAARLALARGNGVPDDTLARDLWGEDVARPVERLRVLVSRLRRSLGPYAGLVSRTPAGFALADLRGFPFARTEGERLDAVRLDLQVDGIEAEPETADHSELHRLAAEHPLHERLAGLSALALYRAGRQADALETLRRLRTALADELGVDPKPETADLELRLLRQDPALSRQTARQTASQTTSQTTSQPARRTSRLPVLHWPAPSTEFVGRDAEHALLTDRLAEPGVITLTGGPGLGKTRLAREVAGTVQNAGRPVAWLDLAPLTSPEAVVAALVAAAGLDTGADDPVRMCAEALAGAVLVVDNAEHLVDAVAELVGRLLRTSEGLSVLVTSQRPLRIAAEELHQVQPLPPHAASVLFCSRSGADPGPDVDAICAAVDRLPLGVELAAGLMRTLTLRQIANRIHDRLRLLVGGPRDTGARHTSLRAALDWSHALLTDQGRVVLRRLSVFAGGCTLEAAEQVLPGDGIDTVDVAVILTELADRCLVTVEEGRRFGLLETVRGYAQDKLRISGEDDAVRARHVQWCTELAADSDQFGRTDPGKPVDQKAMMRRVGAEEANLRVAVEWCLGAGDQPARVTEIVAPLWWYWWYRGLLPAALDWLRKSLAAADRPSVLYAAGLHALSMLTRNVGDHEESLRVARECLQAYQDLDDEAGVAVALHSMALSSLALSDFESSLGYARESENLARSSGTARTVGGAVNCAGLALRNLGRVKEAEAMFAEALEVWTAAGHRHGVAVATGNLGIVARNAGDFARARELLTRCLRLVAEIGYATGIVETMDNLGVLALAEGDPAEALRLLTVSSEYQSRIGAPVFVPDEVTAPDGCGTGRHRGTRPPGAGRRRGRPRARHRHGRPRNHR